MGHQSHPAERHSCHFKFSSESDFIPIPGAEESESVETLRKRNQCINRALGISFRVNGIIIRARFNGCMLVSLHPRALGVASTHISEVCRRDRTGRGREMRFLRRTYVARSFLYGRVIGAHLRVVDVQSYLFILLPAGSGITDEDVRALQMRDGRSALLQYHLVLANRPRTSSWEGEEEAVKFFPRMRYETLRNFGPWMRLKFRVVFPHEECRLQNAHWEKDSPRVYPIPTRRLHLRPGAGDRSVAERRSQHSQTFGTAVSPGNQTFSFEHFPIGESRLMPRKKKNEMKQMLLIIANRIATLSLIVHLY